MKLQQLIITVLIVWMPFKGSCQFAQSVAILGHTTFWNNDVQTNIKLGLLLAELKKRNGTHKDMNKLIQQLITQEKQLLKNKYDKSSHDGQIGFYLKIKGTMALKAAQGILASKFSNGKYMTENKRIYMDHMELDQTIIPSLIYLDKKTITAANRQEIYRLRSEVIRQYSKNDKKVRNMMRIPAAVYVVENEEELLKLIKALEIAL